MRSSPFAKAIFYWTISSFFLMAIVYEAVMPGEQGGYISNLIEVIFGFFILVPFLVLGIFSGAIGVGNVSQDPAFAEPAMLGILIYGTWLVGALPIWFLADGTADSDGDVLPPAQHVLWRAYRHPGTEHFSAAVKSGAAGENLDSKKLYPNDPLNPRPSVGETVYETKALRTMNKEADVALKSLQQQNERLDKAEKERLELIDELNQKLAEAEKLKERIKARR